MTSSPLSFERDPAIRMRPIRWVLALLLLISLGLLSACGSKAESGEIRPPINSSDAKGNYKPVIDQFKTAGFTDVTAEAIPDLVTGFLKKEGDIEDVAIAGKKSFTKDDKYLPSAPVVIRYHTFPPAPTASASQKVSAPSSPVASPTAAASTSSQDQIITRENNAEFDQICNLKDDFDPSIGEFAKKYAGRTVAFDGSIVYLTNHAPYKTRFDLLLQAGDYDPDKSIGPNFKFDNVGVYELHLSGATVPDNLAVGQKYRFTARIQSMDEKAGPFFLVPIKTETR